MTLEQLRIFVAVAEREHMTRASEILRLTQSGVSAAIAALESRYATPLFHRVRRHVELTTAGKLFLIEAKSVLARAAAAEKVLTEISGLKRGVLAIHASQTIAGYWLPKHLTGFHKAYPEIEVRLGIGNTAQVDSAVRSGIAELGFVEGVVDDPLLATDVVAGDQLAVVVGPSHPWFGRKEFQSFELAQTEWVLREQGSGTRSEFANALKSFGLNLQFLRVALELPSNEAVCGAVAAGAGATAISELLVGLAIRAGTLYRLPLAMPARSFSILTHRERHRSKVSEAFQDFIRAATAPKEEPKPLAAVTAAAAAGTTRSRPRQWQPPEKHTVRS